ncbi:hypothetical protein EK21DRAFT_98020 [Setomelanomma holmii]|uniref:Negative regulator of differentiation 1 n=1 Tax=Setomelanomma holmii TaxID=210430 RepID=A0A9P4HI02_9PLEO|nr:hypothetical protein EK21DRAFT_98020 [Setomelanomma holmii]
MATVTIGRSYFEALLRRAQFVSVMDHTSDEHVDFRPNLFNNVTISKAEHEYMAMVSRTPYLLKSALFRGGLTNETLETLLAGESSAMEDETSQYDFHAMEDETSQYDFHADASYSGTRAIPSGQADSSHTERSPVSDDTAICHGSLPHARAAFQRTVSYGQPDSSTGSPPKDHDGQNSTRRVPVHDQRTICITNLSERTTHKDFAGIIRGGRLLDIFLRSDRSATVSFVEGAAEFLAYTKRKDIYLHTKRIANGATRNLVVRGIAGKLTADQIRDHLDHIHNLVVVDISFQNGDAYISTNSIHNALFARTCMMSRTAYKGSRVEHYPDECAAPLPQPPKNHYSTAPPAPAKSKPITNAYALLDTGSDLESESEEESYMSEGVRVDQHAWRNMAVA